MHKISALHSHRYHLKWIASEYAMDSLSWYWQQQRILWLGEVRSMMVCNTKRFAILNCIALLCTHLKFQMYLSKSKTILLFRCGSGSRMAKGTLWIAILRTDSAVWYNTLLAHVSTKLYITNIFKINYILMCCWL